MSSTEYSYLSADFVFGEEAHQTVSSDVQESVRVDDFTETFRQKNVQSLL